MRNATLVSVEEYLATAYAPDCDYVDDHIEERHLGQKPHRGLQVDLIFYLRNRLKKWGIRACSEQRVQTTPTRFRIPDVCVTLGEPDEMIFRTAPRAFCIG